MSTSETSSDTTTHGHCPECWPTGTVRNDCEVCGGSGWLPPAPAPPEPRTPDETLAARLERMAGDGSIAAYYVNDLYDAAKRLRELAGENVRLAEALTEIETLPQFGPRAEYDEGWACVMDKGEDGWIDMEQVLPIINAARAAQPTEGTDA